VPLISAQYNLGYSNNLYHYLTPNVRIRTDNYIPTINFIA
jgi:hypothetical protein